MSDPYYDTDPLGLANGIDILFIDQNNPNASDDYTREQALDPETPWLTLAALHEGRDTTAARWDDPAYYRQRLQSGDTVYIREGDYQGAHVRNGVVTPTRTFGNSNDSITIKTDGTPTQRITIRCYPEDTVRITGSSDETVDVSSLLQIRGHYVTVTGITFQGYETDPDLCDGVEGHPWSVEDPYSVTRVYTSAAELLLFSMKFDRRIYPEPADPDDPYFAGVEAIWTTLPESEDPYVTRDDFRIWYFYDSDDDEHRWYISYRNKSGHVNNCTIGPNGGYDDCLQRTPSQQGLNFYACNDGIVEDSILFCVDENGYHNNPEGIYPDEDNPSGDALMIEHCKDTTVRGCTFGAAFHNALVNRFQNERTLIEDNYFRNPLHNCIGNSGNPPVDTATGEDYRSIYTVIRRNTFVDGNTRTKWRTGTQIQNLYAPYMDVYNNIIVNVGYGGGCTSASGYNYTDDGTLFCEPVHDCRIFNNLVIKGATACFGMSRCPVDMLVANNLFIGLGDYENRPESQWRDDYAQFGLMRMWTHDYFGDNDEMDAVFADPAGHTDNGWFSNTIRNNLFAHQDNEPAQQHVLRHYNVGASTLHTGFTDEFLNSMPNATENLLLGEDPYVSFRSVLEDLFVDPDAGDYHLKAGSAAIDAGYVLPFTTDIQGNSVMEDYDGNPRPTQGAWDVGPLQYQSQEEPYVPGQPEEEEPEPPEEVQIVPGKVDVCYVVDYSGSMADNIDHVKQQIVRMTQSLSEHCSDPRFGLVIFGSGLNYNDPYIGVEDPYGHHILEIVCDPPGYCDLCECRTATVSFSWAPTDHTDPDCVDWDAFGNPLNWQFACEYVGQVGDKCTWFTDDTQGFFDTVSATVTIEMLNPTTYEVCYIIEVTKGLLEFQLHGAGDSECCHTISSSIKDEICSGIQTETGSCITCCGEGCLDSDTANVFLQMSDCDAPETPRTHYIIDGLDLIGVDDGFSSSIADIRSALDYPIGGSYEPAFSALRWAAKDSGFNWRNDATKYAVLVTDETYEDQSNAESVLGCSPASPYENTPAGARSDLESESITVFLVSDDDGLDSFSEHLGTEIDPYVYEITFAEIISEFAELAGYICSAPAKIINSIRWWVM